MSCSIVAVPFALAHIVILMTGAAISGISAAHHQQQEAKLNEYALNMANNFKEEAQHIVVNDLVEKEFETAYMDKDILMKTLEEHGLSDIETEYDGKISGTIDNFTLVFEKPAPDKPYVLKITCKECDNADEKIDDLNSEYSLNVQEEAYLKLIERLKDNNMHVEEEVVEEDNTIVLTINLE